MTTPVDQQTPAPDTGPRRGPPRRPAPRRSPVGWIVLLGLVGFGMMATFATCGRVLSTSGEQIIGSGSDRVGVIELTGQIADTTETIRHVRDFAGRDDLLAIVVRIDSPGGAVAPSQELFDALRAAADDKPVVASMGNVAASGGLWVALAADWIFASAGSVTGSIGVIAQNPDLRAVAELLRLNVRTFKSGPLKDVGNPLRAMTPADEALYMELVSDIYDQFVGVVVQRRKLEPAVVQQFADGRIVTGRVALRLGLIDQLGGLYDAAEKAVELARQRDPSDDHDEIDPTLVYPESPVPSVVELLSRRAGVGFVEGAAGQLDRASRRAVEGLYRRGQYVELR